PPAAAPPGGQETAPTPDSTGSEPAQPETQKDAASRPAEKPAPAKTVTAAHSPMAKLAADDKLAAEGEKSLYGNGVPQDCARAQKDLSKAAGHSNAAAQSLLGAMYATGHCVDRDLPMAYRWFAHALHNDP